MEIDGYVKLSNIISSIRDEIDFSDIEEINGVEYVHQDVLEEVKQVMDEKRDIGDLLSDISGDNEVRFEFDEDFLLEWHDEDD